MAPANTFGADVYPPSNSHFKTTVLVLSCVNKATSWELGVRVRRSLRVKVPVTLVSTSLNQLISRELSEVETRQRGYFLSGRSP
jgi:CHASE3 domain sensor protein